MKDRFLRACRGQPVDAVPVWFMRQAGRYMQEYRALRSHHSMLEMCRTPELVVQTTMQPLRLGVDAAILFSDILLPLEPMGAPVEFSKSEGPVIHAPLRETDDIERLQVIDPAESLPFVLESIRLLRKELSVPLIGFAGGPFTLASYLIEGGRSTHFAHTKRLMYGYPEGWDQLLTKFSEVTRRLLRAQVEAGAQAVQLFDSWIGQLTVDDYERSVAPYTRPILEDIESMGVPVIYFGVGTGALLESMAATGGTVIGVDWRVRINEAWERIGKSKAIQGNLDPTALLAPREVIQRKARMILRRTGHQAGHIFNLGHGILPETSPDEVKALVDFVHEESSAALAIQEA